MDAHVFLEVAYAQLNRIPEEISECRFVLQVVPDHFGSNLNLGRFLIKSGDLEGAIPSLQKAAAIRPTRPGPHFYLADVYTKLGRQEDARKEQAEAERLAAQLKNQPKPAPETQPELPSEMNGPGKGE